MIQRWWDRVIRLATVLIVLSVICGAVWAFEHPIVLVSIAGAVAAVFAWIGYRAVKYKRTLRKLRNNYDTARRR
jgi:hypothetical protein